MKSDEYLAGLFDGEGSFSIQVGLRSRNDRISAWFNPSMSMILYYGDEVLQHFVDRFGGQIYPYKKGGSRWHLGTKQGLLVAAADLQPHLEIKANIAERFLHALSLFPEHAGQARNKGERKWTPEISVAVAEIALTLNPPRSRKSNKTLEYLTVLREGVAA